MFFNCLWFYSNGRYWRHFGYSCWYPLVTLCVDMIGKGTSPRIDQIQYFVEHFSSSNQKTKQCLQDNILALISVLAFDTVSTQCDQMVVFQLMTINVDLIIANYKLKEYPQEKVFNYCLPYWC